MLMIDREIPNFGFRNWISINGLLLMNVQPRDRFFEFSLHWPAVTMNKFSIFPNQFYKIR